VEVFCAKQALLTAHEDMRLTPAPFPPPASPFHPISQRPSELSFSGLQVTIATLGAVFGGSLQMACSTNSVVLLQIRAVVATSQ
jgi:hypothetical protein